MSDEWNNQACMNNLTRKWYLATVAFEQMAFDALELSCPQKEESKP